MQIGGISSSASLLHAATLQQANTNALTKTHDAQQAQASAAALNASGEEAEQSPDGDERGGNFSAIG